MNHNKQNHTAMTKEQMIISMLETLIADGYQDEVDTLFRLHFPEYYNDWAVDEAIQRGLEKQDSNVLPY